MDKTKINNSIDEVIETSKEIRNQLLELHDKSSISTRALQTYRTILDANKNIVSASIVAITIEKMK